MAKVENIVFLSLVLDLFAFTIPLPLFPRIIEWYTLRESSDPHGLLSRTLWAVSTIRGQLYNPSHNSKRWDIVLLGGLMGSVFSTLQFLVSPYIGSLSDKYGRKKILLITMMGNILSALVWIKSTTFASYMLSRIIGGLSEGNVQLAIAILSDITTPANRAKALSHVGIAFAICFCIGPPIGAYFASRPVAFGQFLGTELNVYAAPALLTLVLLVVETAFLAVALPETRNKRFSVQSPDHIEGHSSDHAASGKGGSPMKKDEAAALVRPAKQRIKTLKTLRVLHFLFLGAFSGVEFTLTFLTFDLFDWNNTQNGKLIGSIGIVSAALQGGYVRRALTRVGELKMARRGISSCAIGLAALALLPHFTVSQPKLAFRLLQAASVCMAFTSATVVNALTAHASLQCDEAPVVTAESSNGTPLKVVNLPELAKGQALGRFRSSGQLGRAIGPLLACASYWTFGPSITYAISAVAMAGLSAHVRKVASEMAVKTT
ncbi:major facilitator superfamily domain-containing protein [Multifurca ochricompacta]|uniref:Major facilitator superfamily domain-containing protein n=1 Tax=Multifurca ochricompacta TaxID=376703 RepID=A0AAD4MBF0_9AGAM|nr:major facilitator superfamily domain-containing protein [Multifurca ochricompacta]